MVLRGVEVLGPGELEDREVVIETERRVIYALPSRPGCLLKRSKGARAFRHPRRLRRELGKVLPHTLHGPLNCELSHQMELRRRGLADAACPIPPLRAVGRVEGDPAILVDAITFQGALGPNLLELRDGPGYPRDLAELMTAFAARAFRSGLRVHDPNPGNFVLGDAGGERRVWLVDGIGERKRLSWRRWNPVARNAELSRMCARVAEQLALRWDPGQRRFDRDERG